MDKLKCPNCKGTNVAYAIPDWEDGKLIDHGSFECFDCLFHTGSKNTEAEIMAALTRPEAVERVTEKIEFAEGHWLSLKNERQIVDKKLRELENAYVEQGAILEAVQDILEGKEVSDFMMSFPIVREAWDMTKGVTPAPIPPEKLEAGRYLMTVPVEIDYGPCANSPMIMKVPAQPIMYVGQIPGATFVKEPV